MRIIMINKFLYPRGGAETYALELGQELKRQGHVVEYFGMYDESNVVTNRCALYTSPLDFHSPKLSDATYPFRIVWSKEAYKKMKKLINSFHPDIIHLNNFNYHVTPSVIDAAYECGVPVVVTAHDSQFVCPNHLMYDFVHNTVCTKCIDTGNPKYCFETRCIHGSKAKSLIGTIEGKLYKKRDTYEHIDKIISPSEFIKRKLETDKRFLGKIVVMSNYVNPLKESYVQPERKDYIFYFGRLSQEKGVINILEAAKALSDKTFVLAGSGPDEDKLKDIPNIKLTGFCNKEQLKDYILKAKLVILPSTCYENCPLAVIEAQQLGAAVLAPAYGGATELTDKKYQIEDTSPEALINALREISDNEEILGYMRKDSLKRTSEYKTLQEYAKEVEKIYCEVIKR